MSQMPIVTVATDNMDRSITIATVDGKRIEYFVGDRFEWLRKSLETWIKDEWYNYSIAVLTRYASQIVTNGQKQEVRDYEGAVTGRYTRSFGVSRYGSNSWACPFEVLERQQEAEDMVARKKVVEAQYQSTPSKKFPFTVIATQAQTLYYLKPRKWFKSEAEAKADASEVIARNDVELAIVKCVDVVKRKVTTPLTSTFK